jgi:glycosyltransferase involved in cell wall biosynthesis
VTFVGFLSAEELAQEYSSAWCSVLPSFTESLPSVVTESLLCGTAVIGTDVGAVREMIGEHGAVCAPRDPLALALTLGSACAAGPANHEARQAMRQWAIARSSAEQMIASHGVLYDRVLATPTQSRAGYRALAWALDRGYRVRRSSARPG